METKNDFSYQFHSSKSTSDIFPILQNVELWWSGLFGERISGQSLKIGDEFTFSAGEGVHFSKQKLINLETDKKLAWLVTESNLSFLENKNEWVNTTINFDIKETDSGTDICFTHKGLVPKFECYGNCTVAWTMYLENLKILLK